MVSTNPAPGENVNVKEGEIVNVTISVGMPQTSVNISDSKSNDESGKNPYENQSSSGESTNSQLSAE